MRKPKPEVEPLPQLIAYRLMLRYITSIGFLLLIGFSGLVMADNISSENPLLIDYRKQISLVSDNDNAIQIQVFGDGTVRVHQPYFMRRAGDYSLRLDQAEMNQLMAQMHGLGVDRFDPDVTSAELKSATTQAFNRSMQDGSLRIIQTDPNMTRIRIAIQGDAKNMHEFAFRGVKAQARLYPQVVALSELAQAIERLDRLGKDSRLQLQAVEQ